MYCWRNEKWWESHYYQCGCVNLQGWMHGADTIDLQKRTGADEIKCLVRVHHFISCCCFVAAQIHQSNDRYWVICQRQHAILPRTRSFSRPSSLLRWCYAQRECRTRGEKTNFFWLGIEHNNFYFMKFTVNIVFLFFIYDPKNQTKEMETKQKRLKLLFAIICNNLVKQKQMKHTHTQKWLDFICIQLRIHIKRTSKWSRNNAFICEMRAKWRIAQYLRPTTATLLFQYSVHLSKMERTGRCLRLSLPLLRRVVYSSRVLTERRFAVPFACRWEQIPIPLRTHQLRRLFSLFSRKEMFLNFISVRFYRVNFVVQHVQCSSSWCADASYSTNRLKHTETEHIMKLITSHQQSTQPTAANGICFLFFL